MIRLQSLTPEDLVVLLERLRLLWAHGDTEKLPVPDAAIHAFLRHCSTKIGDAYFRTPRNTIRAFLDLLAVLEQNPDASWETLLSAIELSVDGPPTLTEIDDQAAESASSLAGRTNGAGGDGLTGLRI